MTGKSQVANVLYRYKYFIALAIVGVLVTAQASDVYSISSSTVATYSKWSFVNPQSYTVFSDGTTTYAKSGVTGAIDYSGTNSASVIQSALNALTAGRTWKETVNIVGPLTISSQINIPSYTEVKINGKITQASGSAMTAMFKNADAGVSIDTNIEIDGGILDGNRATGATGHGIQLDGTTDSSIHDITILNNGGSSAKGIYLTTTDSSRMSQRLQLNNIRIDNTGNSAIEFAGSTSDSTLLIRGIVATNLVLTNTGHRGIEFTNVHNSTVAGVFIKNVATHGMDFSYNSTDNAISNFVVANATLNGLNVNTHSSDRNVFSNFQIMNAHNQGVETSAMNLVFTNFEIVDSSQYGMRIATGSDRCTITNGIVRNSGQSSANTYSGIILVSTDNCIITNNQVYDDQSVKTQRYGIVMDASSDTNQVYNNNVSGNLQTNGISDSGTGNIIRNNRGFVTENKGTGTINSGSTSATVSHGLSYTPSAGECSVTWTENPTNDPGNWWLSSITSSQFTVNVRADPGASNLDFSWACRRI